MMDTDSRLAALSKLYADVVDLIEIDVASILRGWHTNEDEARIDQIHDAMAGYDVRVLVHFLAATLGRTIARHSFTTDEPSALVIGDLRRRAASAVDFAEDVIRQGGDL
jgi:FPC/CPF motif-containing protein YcgG